MIGTSQPKRLLVLCTTTGYQTCAFIEAAQKLGLSITFGTDRCHVLDDPWQDGALPCALKIPKPRRKGSAISPPSILFTRLSPSAIGPPQPALAPAIDSACGDILQKPPTSAAINTVRASACWMPGWRFRRSGDFPCPRTRARLLPLGIGTPRAAHPLAREQSTAVFVI
jgi:hypothetical protein